MISQRLSTLSSSKQEFESSRAIYDSALRKSGYKETISFIPHKTEEEKNEKNRKKQRKRKEIWYVPPFNKNVTTNVGRIFLGLIDKHFGKKRKDNLHKIINRKTVKVGYTCTPNMKDIFASNNANKLEKSNQTDENCEPKCNCNKDNKPTCPLRGNCVVSTVVYKATVTTNEDTRTYIGSTEGDFKSRYNNHTHSFRTESKRHTTALADFIWKQKLKNTDEDRFEIKWDIIKKCKRYVPGAKKCDLCLTEKLSILRETSSNSLNKRSELIAKCPHRRKFILENIK